MFAITGASGQLGRLVIEQLLETVPADQIVAAVRDPAKVGDLAERGVVVREADYTRPNSLPGALAGVDKLLLISSTEVSGRVPLHRGVIDAAWAAACRPWPTRACCTPTRPRPDWRSSTCRPKRP